MENLFATLQAIVTTSKVVIDRPKGSAHPRYPDYIYPLDYGYLEGTKSQDGSGIDVWIGGDDQQKISGLLVIADGLKKDSEIKVLLGCNKKEMQMALGKSNQGSMSAALIENGETV